MDDNQLIKLILDTLNPLLSAAGIPGVPVAQANQPTQQGVFVEPSMYLHKMGDVRIGWPGKSDQWDEVNQVETYTQDQVYGTMFQLSALATQAPGNTTQFTASDILNRASLVLESDPLLAAFSAAGVGLLRIPNAQNPYFKDDRGRFEASPNLTFTVTHDRIFSISEPYTEVITVNLLPVP